MVAYLKPRYVMYGVDWRMSTLVESPTVTCFALKLCDDGLSFLGSVVFLTESTTEEVEIGLIPENNEPKEQFDPQIVSR